jgi:hypothetical protein
MIESDAELRCGRTGMPMSRRLERGLTDVFITQVRPQQRAAVAVRLRHPFFCPGCGVQMTHDGCPHCGRVLDKFAHDIIELHPHE